MTLILTLTALMGAIAAQDDARPAAAQALQSALHDAAQATRAGREAGAALERGLAAAVEVLGPASETAAELERLARGARIEGLIAGDDGAPWLAQKLPALISDLRFEPVQEAAQPAGFPPWTPVGEIRIQDYPAYRMARTSLGPPGSDGAFWKLFGHIQGNEIAMTAPVETTYTGEGGARTGSSMAFLYGSRRLGRLGSEGPVEVVDVPAQVVVSAGLRGVESPERIADACQRLERWLRARSGWIAAGPARSMGYNSPRVVGDRRYFEVQIPVKRAGTMLIDFGAAGEEARWRAVDDVVMGGRSSSRVEATPQGTCLFTGELSLENNGGFASVRRDADELELAGAGAVVLRVRGDGKTYRLRLRTDCGSDAPSYQADFQTVAGEWTDVTLELTDFELKWRGRVLPDAPRLDASRVLGLGLLIADGQVGSFRLELASLSRP